MRLTLELKGLLATFGMFLTGIFTPAMIPASIFTAPLQDLAFGVTILVGLVTLAKLYCWFKDRRRQSRP